MTKNFRHTVYNHLVLYSNIGSADDITDLNIYYVESLRQLGATDCTIEIINSDVHLKYSTEICPSHLLFR